MIHSLYYFYLKQQIFARFARFSSISHNINQFNPENRIFKRYLSSKSTTFAARIFSIFPLKCILPTPKKQNKQQHPRCRCCSLSAVEWFDMRFNRSLHAWYCVRSVYASPFETTSFGLLLRFVVKPTQPQHSSNSVVCVVGFGQRFSIKNLFHIFRPTSTNNIFRVATATQLFFKNDAQSRYSIAFQQRA